ncbi:MAG: hypothetical protein CSA76_00310 [Spirochaetales bacterium]|nr:MAG: hypothetical protein CSA76_00310 [Spirochaetales bacterium]
MNNSEKNQKEKLPAIAELSRRGYRYIKKNQFSEARSCFRQVLEIEKENHYALVGMGDILRKEKRYRESIKYYQQCLSLHPDNHYALFGLADCHRALGDRTSAIEMWTEYLKLDTDNTAVMNRMADAWRKKNNYSESKKYYRKVLELEPDNAYALIGLGHLLFDFKEYEASLEIWKKIEQSQKEDVDIKVLTSLGNCCRKLKLFSEGTGYFARALEKQNDNFYALFGMADCYRGLGSPERSLEYWNRILEADPHNKVIQTRAGDAYRNTGNLDAAERCYQSALKIGFDIYAETGMALIEKSRGMHEEALKRLKPLMEHSPRNHIVALEAAGCAALLGRSSEAVDILKNYLSKGNTSDAVLRMLQELEEQTEQS